VAGAGGWSSGSRGAGRGCPLDARTSVLRGQRRRHGGASRGRLGGLRRRDDRGPQVVAELVLRLGLGGSLDRELAQGLALDLGRVPTEGFDQVRPALGDASIEDVPLGVVVLV